jgi:four helix bundle protein
MQAKRSFRDLRVWQESMQLVEDVYVLCRGFPRDERYALTSQLHRAAVSIPANIGEGSKRKSRRAFLYHLDVALGSQGEVEVLTEIAVRLKFCELEAAAEVLERAEFVGRMLNRLIDSLRVDDPASGR